MSTENENDLVTQRRQDLKELRKIGNAYTNKFKRDSLASDLFSQFQDKTKEELENESVKVAVAGRMMSRRVMGKASFAHIQDMSGKIQLYVKRDDLADGVYNDGFKKWDIGDIIGATGIMMKTNKGELSIHVDSIELSFRNLFVPTVATKSNPMLTNFFATGKILKKTTCRKLNGHVKK